MRSILVALAFVLGCNPNVGKTNELCGKAATMYAQCALGSNATVEQRSDMEIHHNRWTRLCRAVYNGNAEGLYPGEKDTYAGLVADGSAGAAKEFACAANAKTCAEADACGQ